MTCKIIVKVIYAVSGGTSNPTIPSLTQLLIVSLLCVRFVRNGSTFVRMLAAGSVQMCSYVVSSELPPLSTKLAPPLPPTFINAAGKKEYACVSMAAGEISMVASKGCIL